MRPNKFWFLWLLFHKRNLGQRNYVLVTGTENIEQTVIEFACVGEE